MSNKITFSVNLREKKQSVNQLRQKGVLPANIYGEGKPSLSVECPLSKFVALHKKMGESGLVYLKVGDDKKEIPAMLDEIQMDSMSGKVLHVAFQKVNLKEKIESEIPVEFVGEVDVNNSVLVHVKDMILVEALPADLPEKFEVDVSVLTEIGQTITLADLKYDKEKVSLVLGEEGDAEPIVILQEVKEEVVEEPEIPEGEGEAAAESGEAAGEGEAKAEETPAEKTEENKEEKAE